MDLFADAGENSILDLVAVLLLMAIWGGAIVAIDYWGMVRPQRSVAGVLVWKPGDERSSEFVQLAALEPVAMSAE